jgi:hypothetical protein
VLSGVHINLIKSIICIDLINHSAKAQREAASHRGFFKASGTSAELLGFLESAIKSLFYDVFLMLSAGLQLLMERGGLSRFLEPDMGCPSNEQT